MFRLANIRIGTKLAIMSSIGVLLVVGIIVTQYLGNSSVKDANDLAAFQQHIAQDSMRIAEWQTRMQLGVRDVRLARTPENIQKGLSNIDENLKAAVPVVDAMIPKLRVPENRERMQKIRSLLEQYASGAKEIAAIEGDIIRINGSGSADAVARVAELTDQREKFARERTLPIAAQLDELIEKVREVASGLAEKETAAAAQTMTSAERLGMGIGVFAALLLIGSAVFGAFSIARPLGKMANVLNELTKDRLVDVPYTNRGDEVGDIAKATSLFRTSIAEKAINHRVRSALDGAKTNVMIADENYNIIYMNQTMVEMIKAAESDMRKDVPTLDAAKLIGANIDTFHKNPAHQRRILDGLTSTIETDLTIGGRNFHLVVSPIRTSDGRRLGTTVEWKDETQIRALEAVNTRVRSALDTCATNIMVADENYNIVYMNNTMQEMIRGAEVDMRKDVPALDARKLIGANIDTFHKNPAHQRRILDTLTGKIETDLKIGGRSFHLVVSPIQDKAGKRLGTTVEWKDETAEKAIEAEIDTVVKAAVAGDFTRRLSLEGKKGFMLNLAQAMNGLSQNVAAALDDLVRVLSKLAEGDLTQRITAEYQGAFARLKSDANTMAERIGATIGEIKAAAREVTNASAEISTSTTDLSQRTEEQAASLEETSASMEEISATVKKNAESAQQANQSAGNTREVANRGGQVVAKAVDAMAKIEESSRKISDIIGVIDEIARQTNLLALNAAVEAARAGEAGRGFAVVASEVRSLAQRSSQAAKDIKDLITNSNSQVKDGVELVNKAGTALTEIVESIKKVAEVVSDIASASLEQATGLEQINKALTQMDEVTQQNSALVEENAATAKTLEEQAKAMDTRVAFFRIDGAADLASIELKAASAGGSVHRSAGVAAAKPQPAARPKPQPVAKRAANGGGPVGQMRAALTTAVNSDPDWKEF
ncbi:MAG TPA: methyl-accepting chemotaxis protein [Xanthobacteraceae bacterium]|nr:methyl-accepting chemotaxis protein [Xanthobacteraceae bacterium]